MIDTNAILKQLNEVASPEHFDKLKRFGIKDTKALGVRMPDIRKLAKKIGKNHRLALALWDTEVHEARILASFITSPNELTEAQFDQWVSDFDSWDMCDATCDLLARCPLAQQKIDEYAANEKEFVKRTAFVMMCDMAFHKNKQNQDFSHYFELIEREAWDERNFVRKAVNWALRQIGKRNEVLRLQAIECAKRILVQNTKSAKWIASDALRELSSDKTIAYVNRHTCKS